MGKGVQPGYRRPRKGRVAVYRFWKGGGSMGSQGPNEPVPPPVVQVSPTELAGDWQVDSAAGERGPGVVP